MVIASDGIDLDAARDRAKQVAVQCRVLLTCIQESERAAVGSPAKAASGDDIGKIVNVLLRFPRVARQLRARHAGRQTLEVEDEYDVQDLLHALFRLFFEDIRPEEWTPSYAGKAARMDFLLKNERIVVEVKMTRPTLGEKEVGDELLVDIARYRTQPDCKTLICFVYDPMGRIGNPDGLEQDLSREADGLVVQVVVVLKSHSQWSVKNPVFSIA